MNIFYNKFVFKDSKSSRKRLLNRVQAERQAGRVKIADENLGKVESLIMDGDPVEASDYILYGAIKIFECI